MAHMDTPSTTPRLQIYKKAQQNLIWRGVCENIFTCNLYNKYFRRDKNSLAPCPGIGSSGSTSSIYRATLYQLPGDNI